MRIDEAEHARAGSDSLRIGTHEVSKVWCSSEYAYLVIGLIVSDTISKESRYKHTSSHRCCAAVNSIGDDAEGRCHVE